jgi:hypothetical protein
LQTAVKIALIFNLVVMEKKHQGIPQAVIDAAQHFSYDFISHLGKYQGKDAYVLAYNDNDVDQGLPIVFLFDGKKCKSADFDAPAILSYFASKIS